MKALTRSLAAFNASAAEACNEFDKLCEVRELLIRNPDFVHDWTPVEGWPDTVHKLLKHRPMVDQALAGTGLILHETFIDNNDAILFGNYAIYLVRSIGDGPFKGECVWVLKVPGEPRGQ